MPVRDLADVKREAMRAALARLVVVRLFALPAFSVAVASIVWLDPVPWRVGVALALVAALAPLSAFEYWRWRRGLSTPDALPPNVVAMLWIQLGAVLITGGLEGPLFPVLPVVAMLFSTLFGPGWALGAVLGAQLATVWAAAGLNLAGISLALPQISVSWTPAWTVTLAIAVTVKIGVASKIGAKVRLLVGDLVSDALAAHDRERQAHSDHARELYALTGEIAHELKNPLAAVKGLAALLARDVDGRPAERLAVLRGEVDRMQETLEQFLDLSRPLVPLTQDAVDLGALAREVAQATDGLARSQGLALIVEAHGVVVWADRRKLRQVLVNLVHNAIEAAPAGTEVRIDAAYEVEGVVLTVADRGPGLPDTLIDGLAFEPGVTTRARGSGLGLTIARALVLQHGGAIALQPRDGGGTRVAVTLPAEGA